MRHGYLSELQDKSQSQAQANAAAAAAPGRARCPVGRYGSLFAERLVAPSAGALPDESKVKDVADARSSGVDDPPDKDHGGIPAGYTYFGQLVVHDLTHSVAIAGRDGTATLENLNTANLDLDTIYGGGPARCPHLYQPPYLNADWSRRDGGQHLFYLGRTAKAASFEHAQLPFGDPRDVPRIDTGSAGITATKPPVCVTPLLHDDRNDDNLILSQLTAQLMLVHNAVASYLHRKGDPTNADADLDRRQSFELARYFLVKAYRRVVVHDYLKHLLLRPVYDDLLAGKIEKPPHLPIEFVFGAARVGHAMVRRAYTINPHIDRESGSLGELMAFSGTSASANLPVPADWVVDWSRFLKMRPEDEPQVARRISPFLPPLFVHYNLRNRHGELDGSLSFHDLWRCYQFGVPTGQECAERQFGKMSQNVLKGERMLPTPAFINLHPAEKLMAALDSKQEFLDRTPLSYYLLQEAAVLGCNGRYLGPLGSRIYASTILHALDDDMQIYQAPVGRTALTFPEIVKPAEANPDAVSTLPQLLNVSAMSDDELRKVIVSTVQ